MSAPQIGDRAWLGHVLLAGRHTEAPLSAVEVKMLTLSGAFCTLARLHLQYADGGRKGPPTLIAKLPRNDDGIRAVASAMGLFERERKFYAELAPRFPIRVPRCYFHGDDDDAPLLLEDLGGFKTPDQIAGLSLAQATGMIDRLAAMHARFWDGRGADLASRRWLIQPDDDKLNAARCAIIASGAPQLRSLFAGRLSDAAITATERVSARFAEVLAFCAEGPLTLAHGDSRGENWMFDANGNSAGDAAGEAAGDAVLIDWQTASYARGSQDVAYLMAGSLNPGDQQKHGWDLLRRYHDALRAHGVADYSWDDCVQHYRQHVIYSLYAALGLLGSLASPDLARLADAWVVRNVGLAEAIDAFALLPE